MANSASESNDAVFKLDFDRRRIITMPRGAKRVLIAKAEFNQPATTAPRPSSKPSIPAIDGLMQRAKQAGIYCEMSPAFWCRPRR
jgi:hypothetical protein